MLATPHEGGRALKVQSEAPHLVSLGGGRLSTAVTLHPLPEGLLTLGSAQCADIVVQGTGVEPTHCSLDNTDGVVTLLPLAEMTSVDGVRVMTPTRLTQGSMVCLGRSHYMRFNHPAEARHMRSSLPNAPRISMVPLNFYTVSLPGVDNVDGMDRKPPIVPRRSGRDSWGEVSNSSSCGSQEICSITDNNNPLSPKLFSPFRNVQNQSNEDILRHIESTYDSVDKVPTLAERRLGSMTSLTGINTTLSRDANECRTLTSPSPAFNRNPSPSGRGYTVASPTPSQEERAARKDDLELKRKQAQNDRMREQQAEKNERARLEEILSMCADYERQVQLEKQCKSPGIPQNRIKTNGSLPRDKRLPSPEAELPDVFTFEQKPLPAVASIRSPYENVVYPQSPRTRIRTITTPIRDSSEVSENRLASANDYEFVTSLPRNTSPAPQQSYHKPSTISVNGVQPTGSTSPHMNVTQPHDIPAYRGTSNSNPSPTISNGVGEMSSDGLDVNPVDLLSQALAAMATQSAGLRREAGQSMQAMYEGLRRDRAKLLAAMSGLKRNVTDIEQQEEEMLRELEMERALLDGEWSAQSDKHVQEQKRQTELRGQLTQLDQDVVHFSAREVERQAECKTRLEAALEKVIKSEAELSSCGDDAEKQKHLSERVTVQREILDQEKKLFEDLEFRHLEEEADCLAGHEELQRELSEVTHRLESRQLRLVELESQRLEADHAAQVESQALERQLINNLRKLEEVRNKLRLIETKLEELTSKGLFNSQDSSPDVSSDNDETTVRKPSCSQSPEDIARISRVTKGAPLEITNGSLGRKTLESLQNIERNRQLHLAQQGSQVIENERQRVLELKRRVQDEVRAQWAEQRQRDNNCYSLNSVGSDEASSDVPTESASSDDMMVDKPASDQTTQHQELESSPGLHHLVREKEVDREDQRPLTATDVSMRDRDKAARLQHQRPLTRYLPIRSERLNLRQHIETAGHQVDLCHDVTLDTTSCRGTLHKLGAKFHHWGKRWFVFDRNQRTFTYYTDRAEKKARGGAYFQAIEEVYVDHLNSVKSPSPQLTFVVKTSERTYHLMAPSAEAMRIWVDVVFTGAEGYQEFELGS